MKVKMLEDAPGYPDGVTREQFEKNKTYDVTEDLGAAFVAHNLAEKVRPARGRKDAGGPSENKGV